MLRMNSCVVQVQDVVGGRKEVSLLYTSEEFVPSVLNKIVLAYDQLKQLLGAPLKAELVIPHIWPVNLELHDEFINRKSPFILTAESRSILKEQSNLLHNAINILNAELSNRYLSVPSCISLPNNRQAAAHWNISLKSNLLINGLIPRQRDMESILKRMEDLYSTYVYKIDNYYRFNNLIIAGDSRLEYISKLWPKSSTLQPIILASDEITPENFLEIMNIYAHSNDVVIYVPSVRGLLKAASCTDCYRHPPLQYQSFSRQDQDPEQYVSKLLSVARKKREDENSNSFTLIISCLSPDNLQDEIQTLVNLHSVKIGHFPHRLVADASSQTDQLAKFVEKLNVRLNEACILSQTLVTDVFKFVTDESKWDDRITKTIFDTLSGYKLTQEPPHSIVPFSKGQEKTNLVAINMKVIDLWESKNKVLLKSQVADLRKHSTEKRLSSVVVYSPTSSSSDRDASPQRVTKSSPTVSDKSPQRETRASPAVSNRSSRSDTPVYSSARERSRDKYASTKKYSRKNRHSKDRCGYRERDDNSDYSRSKYKCSASSSKQNHHRSSITYLNGYETSGNKHRHTSRFIATKKYKRQGHSSTSHSRTRSRSRSRSRSRLSSEKKYTRLKSKKAKKQRKSKTER